MNIFRSYFILFALLKCISTKDYNSYTYENFIIDFLRQYEGAEKDDHKAIFDSNMLEIIKRNNEGANLKPNNFTDWNETQLANIFNKVSNLNIASSPRPVRATAAANTIPNSFDWNQLGYVTAVRDQASCGSCWAYSAVAAYESLLAILENKTFYDLSEQYGIECDVKSFGCLGGFPYEMMKLIIRTGVPLQSEYPNQYQSNYYKWQNVDICSAKNSKKINETLNTYHFSNLTIAQMEEDLINYGPYSVGVNGDDFNFLYAGDTGLVQYCPSNRNQINHVVLLYGYNDTHWFVKNSWGSSWGDNGYGYVLKTNDCGIHTYVDQLRTNNPVNPDPTPTDPNFTNLKIVMSDSYGDGWNGYVFGFKQAGSIVANFTLLSGTTPQYYNISTLVALDNRQKTQLIIVSKGSYPEQIQFHIYYENGTLIYQNLYGNLFSKKGALTVFCLSANCVVNTNSTYTFEFVDFWGDGWGSSQIVFRQLGQTWQVGESNSSFYSKSVNFSLNQVVQTQLVVEKADEWSEEIGFVLTDASGNVVLSRLPGRKLMTGQVLGSFCASCPNYNQIIYYQDTIPTRQSQPKKEVSAKETTRLKIVMIDNAGDGWNGNALGLKQNAELVSTFGGTFTNGYQASAFTVQVKSIFEIEVVYVGKANFNQQIGFTVYRQTDNKIVCHRLPGQKFLSTTLLAIFCPSNNCTVIQYVNYYVTVTDLLGDGWDATTFEFFQRGIVTNITGPTAPSRSKTVMLSFLKYQEVKFSIKISDQFTEQIGYWIKNQKGDVIVSRNPGTPIMSSTVLAKICPNCPNFIGQMNQNIATTKLMVQMSDSAGDGWNGVVFGFKQDSQIVGDFGSLFTSGNSYGPVSVQVPSNKETKIVMVKKGQKYGQIGFKVTFQNQTVIYEHSPGSSFSPMHVFDKFCPSSSCKTKGYTSYSVVLTDYWGDGWNGNQIELRQGSKTISLGSEQQSFKSKNMSVWMSKSMKVTVVVSKIGLWSEEIGLSVFDAEGVVVFERKHGVQLELGQALGQFCYQCKADEEAVQTAQPTKVSSSPAVELKQSGTSTATSYTPPSDYNAYKIVTYVLAGVCFLLVLVVVWNIYKIHSKSKQNKAKKMAEKREKDKMKKGQMKIGCSDTLPSTKQLNQGM